MGHAESKLFSRLERATGGTVEHRPMDNDFGNGAVTFPLFGNVIDPIQSDVFTVSRVLLLFVFLSLDQHLFFRRFLFAQLPDLTYQQL